MDEAAVRAAILASLKRVAPDADIDSLDENTTYREQFEFDSVD